MHHLGRKSAGQGKSPEVMSGLRECCHSQEVFSRSISDRGLSRNQDRVADFPDFADSLKDRKVLLNGRRISVLKGAVCGLLKGVARPPRVADTPRSGRSASDEAFQLALKRSWDFQDGSVLVSWDSLLGTIFSGGAQRVVSRRVSLCPFTLPT